MSGDTKEDREQLCLFGKLENDREEKRKRMDYGQNLMHYRKRYMMVEENGKGEAYKKFVDEWSFTTGRQKQTIDNYLSPIKSSEPLWAKMVECLVLTNAKEAIACTT